MSLSDWDPGLFDTLCEHIFTLTDKADPDVITQLSQDMPKIAERFYYLPSASDTLFNIGVFFQNILKFETALRYYEQSLHYFGDSDITYFNMAMCYESVDQPQSALSCLEKALQFNPKASDVKQWIKKLKKV